MPPVRAASALGKSAVLIESPEEERNLTTAARWVLISAHSRFAASAARTGGIPLNGANGTRLWTDDYADVIGAIE
jgi:hypothetical protein